MRQERYGHRLVVAAVNADDVSEVEALRDYNDRVIETRAESFLGYERMAGMG